jgi:hypothetical protein
MVAVSGCLDKINVPSRVMDEDLEEIVSTKCLTELQEETECIIPIICAVPHKKFTECIRAHDYLKSEAEKQEKCNLNRISLFECIDHWFMNLGLNAMMDIRARGCEDVIRKRFDCEDRCGIGSEQCEPLFQQEIACTGPVFGNTFFQQCLEDKGGDETFCRIQQNAYIKHFIDNRIWLAGIQRNANVKVVKLPQDIINQNAASSTPVQTVRQPLPARKQQ